MAVDCRNSYLAASLDCAKECLADLCADGFTEDVVVRTRTWTGPQGARASTFVDVDVTLTPRPRVAPIPLKLVPSAGGRHAEGQRRVSYVSLTYTEADLTMADLADGVERFYLVGGKQYVIASEPHAKLSGWVFDLTRRQSGVV